MTVDIISYWFGSALLMFALGYIIGQKIRWARGIVDAV
jgi:hypothetical protein